MMTVRKRTFQILDLGDKKDRFSIFIDVFLICLISINVLSVILETLPSLKDKYQFAERSRK